MGYTLLLAVLGGLICFSLWQGRGTVPASALRPLLGVVVTFFLGRILVMGEASTLADSSGRYLVWFTLLNMASFYFMAIYLRNAGWMEMKDGENTAVPADIPRLGRQMGYFAAAGALFFLLRPANNTTDGFALGIINFTLLGASIRIIAFVFSEVIELSFSRTCRFCFVVALLTLAWAIYQVLPSMSPKVASAAVLIARLLDATALALVLVNLTATYVRMGMQFKSEANKNREEVNIARSELSKLNSIATNIYEDSSDLIKKQKGRALEYIKRVENLESIIQIGINIQKRSKLEELLQLVVDVISESLSFKTVTLRLLNDKAQTFETKAFVGLAEEDKDTVLSYRIPLSEYQKTIEPRFRISKSYFIRKRGAGSDPETSKDRSVLVENTWGEIDMLIVPMLTDEETIGYLSVENPDDPKLSVADTIDSLEVIATLAVIAIRNASFYKDLEEKNEKLRAYADKLASLNKLKSNFVATISHEFRTPLTSIKAYCDTLLNNLDNVDRELIKQFLVVIDEESARLTALIDDILDFSHMESGAIKFQRKPCDVNGLVTKAVNEQKKDFESKELKLETNLPDNPVNVRAEEDLLKQMFVNLLDNASKFSPDGGTVSITLIDDVGAARVQIEDNGMGVPDDQLAKIFEEFHQADSSSTREHGGSGLGLAICKNIAEWHDGRIWVENIPGGGARFVVVIPKKEVTVRSHPMQVSSTVRRFEIERFLELIVENVSELVGARKASMMIMDEAENELRIESAIGIDEEIVEHARVKPGEGIAGKVVERGRSMLVTDIESDDRLTRSNNALLYGSKSFLSVPIKRGDEVIGVVNVASPSRKRAFDSEDQLLLEVFVSRVAAALDTLRAFAATSLNYERAREAFKAIIEARRYIEVNRDTLIINTACKVGRRLGLDDRAVSSLRYILNIYDLGLTRIGYHIIKKPNELTPKELEEIRKHPVIGTELLSAIEASPGIRDVILHHHENFDGTGYPDGIAGQAIPIQSRIVRVADALRALVSERPYQRQYSLKEALEVLKHRSGTFFDPVVVEYFVEAALDPDDDERGAPTRTGSETTRQETIEQPN